MAKNQVTLTFAGDSKSLERTFDKVGRGAKDMGKDFDKAASDAKSMASRVDAAGSAVGSQESKFMGTADVLDGLASAFGLNIDRQIELARAAGDVAGGIENLKGTFSSAVGKVTDYAKSLFGSTAATTGNTAATTANSAATSTNTIKTSAQAAATTTATGAQNALNVAMRANPIALVVTALAALAVGLVIAYQKSETFRRIVNGAFNVVKGAAQGALNVILGIVGAIRKVLEWLGILDSKGKDSAKQFRDSMASVQASARESARATGATVPSNFVGGRDLVKRHSGGWVPGQPGTEVPIMAMAGEYVSPRGRAPSGGNTYNLTVNALDPRSAADLVMRAIDEGERQNGRKYARA